MLPAPLPRPPTNPLQNRTNQPDRRTAPPHPINEPGRKLPLALIPGYHPIYADADPELLVLINDKAANGRLRSWAAFTHTASGICRGIRAERIDTTIVRNAISQLGNAR